MQRYWVELDTFGGSLTLTAAPDGAYYLVDDANALIADLLQALRHVTHNARKSGAEMGLALDVADGAIAKAASVIDAATR